MLLNMDDPLKSLKVQFINSTNETVGEWINKFNNQIFKPIIFHRYLNLKNFEEKYIY